MGSENLGTAMMKDVDRTLRNSVLFRGVPEEPRQRIERRCSWRSYLIGEHIIEHKDLSRDVFFLVSGQARVTIYSSEGRAVAFRDLSPGDVFGELAAIDGRLRSASVEAMTPCLTASMPPKQFIEAATAEPDLALALVEHLVRQIRDLTDRVFEFSTLPVRNRIHAELLRLARRASAAANQVVLAPAPTHADIAIHVSTHREAVSREMSELARRGIVKRTGSSLLIADVARLERMVREAIDPD